MINVKCEYVQIFTIRIFITENLLLQLNICVSIIIILLTTFYVKKLRQSFLVIETPTIATLDQNNIW